MVDERFREPERGSGLWRLPWLVQCPRCGEQGVLTAANGTPTLTCSDCGLVRPGPVAVSPDGTVQQQTAATGAWRRDRTPRPHWPTGHDDTYELWLRTPCAGHVLWATNDKHLAYLANYIGATLREGTHVPSQKLHHRLPTWMKLAKHRDEVLRSIDLLRDRLPSN